MIYNLKDRKIEVRAEEYFIADNATLIGSVVLHNNVSIWYNAVLRGDNDRIVIEKNSNIQDGAILHTDHGIALKIGKNVTVGHKAMLHGCVVRDNTLIGINAVILNHAVIGEHCIIGANTLIPEGKIIPDNSIVMGVPGKIIKLISEEQKTKLKNNVDIYVANFKR